MNEQIIGVFQCPDCKGKLTFGRSEPDSEALACASCGRLHRVIDGIPRFVPEPNYADSFGYQWNVHAKTQLDSNCGVAVSRDRVNLVTQWPAKLEGELVLEAGSGAGRFTEVLVKTGATILSFDYLTAVDANQRNNGDSENLVLFQGDIFNIPVKDCSVDRVFCLGVIQHTPDPHAAFVSLASKLKPGGSLVIDIYADDWKARMQWKYLLRPLTKRMNSLRLYNFIAAVTPTLVPVTRFLRSIAGRTGARISPIVEYSYLGLRPDINEQWAILDTFDMYSPAHDHPKSQDEVQSWFREIGFENVEVCRGPNGVVGRGTRPAR